MPSFSSHSKCISHRRVIQDWCRIRKPAASSLFAGLIGILALGLFLVQMPTAHAAPLGLWQNEASLTTARWGHTATLLPNGNVLVAGGYSDAYGYLSSAELYNPNTNTWSSAGMMAHARAVFTATLLRTGKVLVVGGYDASLQSLASAELYDPVTNTWSSAGTMTDARSGHTATLLQDGRVLVAGGGHNPYNGSYLATAELYDPTTNSWSPAASMQQGRFYHSATLLQDGRVLIAGGRTATPLNTAELYDPVTDAWTPAGTFAVARSGHTASLLNDGRVLIAGGTDASNLPTADAEMFDPATTTWQSMAAMTTPRAGHTATTLSNGSVLVVGGNAGSSQYLQSAELYNPVTNSWTSAGVMSDARQSHTAVLLNDGAVLIAGGYHGFPIATVERYTPADTIPPTTMARLSGTQGQSGWYVGPVTLALSATDNLGGSGVAATRYSTDGGTSWQSYTSPVQFPHDGSYVVDYFSTDVAGNTEQIRTISFRIDQTPPAIRINGVRDGATYVLGNAPTPGYQVTDAGSGVATQNATFMVPDTESGAGTYTYRVQASDHAGNTASLTVSYQVIYGFGGFLTPPPGAVVHRGQQVWVTFSLTDASGHAVPDAQGMLDINSEPATSHLQSGNVVSYDTVHQTYVYLLNTSDMPVGTDTLSVILDDGTVHQITVQVH